MKDYDKPNNKIKVSILLAVYKPNEKWLIELLQSLNNQDQDNLELLIWDDCPESPVEEAVFAEYITRFPYTLFRGVQNLGSNGAFEELTKRANGEYICYCDQDDIWNKNKVSAMLEKIVETGSVLVCCDQYIIDENGVRTHDSITQIRKRHTWREGYGLAKYLISDNFITGCALIVKTKVAQSAVPFEPLYVHDQWVGIIAALQGKIEVIYEPLIGYRQHSSNQTGILTGVQDKESYYQWRIEYFLRRVKAVKKRLAAEEEIQEAIKRYEQWLQARESFFKTHKYKDYKVMWNGRDLHKTSVMLELVLPIMPGFMFRWFIRMAKKGIL